MLGKSLQVFALCLLPLAILLELMGLLGRDELAHMLLMMVMGMAAFGMGRILEGFGTDAKQ